MEPNINDPAVPDPNAPADPAPPAQPADPAPPAQPIVPEVVPAVVPPKSDLHALITPEESKSLQLDLYSPDVQKGILIQYLTNRSAGSRTLVGNPQKATPQAVIPDVQLVNTRTPGLLKAMGRKK